MSVSIQEVAHFYLNGNEIFTAENDDYIYYKDEMLRQIAEKNNCAVDEIKVEVKEYSDDEYEIVRCEYCLRAGIYKYESKEQYHDFMEYFLYGNPKRKLIQEIVPNMQPWMREAFMRASMGVLCSEDCYNGYHGLETEDDEEE